MELLRSAAKEGLTLRLTMDVEVTNYHGVPILQRPTLSLLQGLLVIREGNISALLRLAMGIVSKVREPVFVPGTSCCTTIGFSHFPHEHLVFIVGFSNTKGYLTIGVCLVAPNSNCLTQFWVKQAPGGPL